MPQGPKPSSPWFDSTPDRIRYPTLEGTVEADVVVVGGGISGIMCAWHLAGAGLSVVLLEKNRIASGDTGFTTGFLLRAPDTSIAALEKRYGAVFVKQLFEASAMAQRTVRDLVRGRRIDCGFSDADAYYSSYQAGDAALKEEWKAISAAEPRAAFISGKGLPAPGAGMAEAVRFSGEAQFDPRRFIFGLLGLPEASRIRIFEESEVIAVSVEGVVEARTARGAAKGKKIVVASGLPIESFSELRPMFRPKITYALAARYEGKAPLSPDLFWDTFDPYFYYRRLDDRTIIIGGSDRRPGDKQEGPRPHDKLRAFLDEHMPGTYAVTNAWSGMLYESPDGLPFASEHPHYRGKVFIGSGGFGGNGLVLGTLAGSVIADLVAGKENPYAKMLSFDRVGAEIQGPGAMAAKPQGSKTRVFIKMATVADVPSGSAYRASADGKRVAIFKADGGYYAIDDTCTHAGGSLSDGALEKDVVTCPLHGARFDVKSGAVVGPPATRPVTSYKTRVDGDSIEVEAGDATPQPVKPKAVQPAPRAGPGLFEGASRNIGYVLGASALALVFWALQFLYVFFVAVPGDLERSIILASSYSGATLIGIALMIGPIAVLIGRNYIMHRRAFGVWGFTFILSHVAWVFIHYHLGVQSFLGDLDPYSNAIIFGALAFTLFIPIYLTSTDWAVSRLGARRWKAVHRLVYLAYLFATLHYIKINPAFIWNLPKALLMAVTVAAYALELSAYAKYMSRKRTIGNMLYGGALIVFGIILLFLAFK